MTASKLLNEKYSTGIQLLCSTTQAFQCIELLHLIATYFPIYVLMMIDKSRKTFKQNIYQSSCYRYGALEQGLFIEFPAAVWRNTPGLKILRLRFPGLMIPG